MLSEAHLADSQTSSKTWAQILKIVNPQLLVLAADVPQNATSAASGKKVVAKLKSMALDTLDWEVGVPAETHVAWVAAVCSSWKKEKERLELQQQHKQQQQQTERSMEGLSTLADVAAMASSAVVVPPPPSPSPPTCGSTTVLPNHHHHHEMTHSMSQESCPSMIGDKVYLKEGGAYNLFGMTKNSDHENLLLIQSDSIPTTHSYSSYANDATQTALFVVPESESSIIINNDSNNNNNDNNNTLLSFLQPSARRPTPPPSPLEHTSTTRTAPSRLFPGSLKRKIADTSSNSSNTYTTGSIPPISSSSSFKKVKHENQIYVGHSTSSSSWMDVVMG
jgi:hypothetical protein